MKIIFLKKIKSPAGFTVAELLVVSAIFMIISISALVNFRRGEQVGVLRLATDQLASNIREAQTKTLSGSQQQEISAAGGFGVYFNTNQNGQYLLFRDNGDNIYDVNDDFILETVLLPQNMTINSLTADPLSIVFQPPKPTIYLNGLQEINDASVILFSSSISNKQGVAGLNRFTGRVTSAIQDR